MPKKIKEESVEEEVKVEEVEEVVEDTVETPEGKSAKGKASKIEYPTVVGNGKFQIIAHAEGYLLYNPDGVRVSGVETEAKAKDLALRMNNSMGLK